MVSSRPEIEWDEPEQTWMLALQYYRDGLCPLCGMPRSICGDPENEMKVKSPPPSRCHFTTARLRRQESQTSGQVKPKYEGALLYTAGIPN
ncbi:hypothetical protein GCM10009611_03080 [Arthrobacter roseus]